MFTTRHMGHYMPVTWITLGIDYLIWGMKPVGYHLTNLLLHAGNGELFFLVLLALLRRGDRPSDGKILVWAAAAGALFFAIHPLRVESVAWATERRDVLSGLFLLLTVLAYLKMTRGEAARKWLLIALGCYALSLLSKSAGMVLPAALLVLDACPLGRLRRDRIRSVLIEKIPFALMAAAAAVPAYLAQRSAGAMSSLEQAGVADRVMQSAYGLCFYVWKTVAPVDLSPLYLMRPEAQTLLSVAAVVVVTGVLIIFRRRWPAALAAWAAYVFILLPVVGLVKIGPQLVADRYSYLSCLPWAMLFGGGVALLCRRTGTFLNPRSVTATAAVILAVFGILTFRQTRVWKDSITLWTHALRLDSSNVRALINRGNVLGAQGKLKVAIRDFNAALTIDPNSAEALTQRAFARSGMGDHQGAIDDSSAALRLDSDSRWAFTVRGDAHRHARNWSAAVLDYDAVLRLAPDDVLTTYNRGICRLNKGDFQGAIEDVARSLQMAPPDWPHRERGEKLLRQLKDAGTPR